MSKMKKNYADMDPIEEIRAIRAELSRKFPTARAFGDYLRAKYPDAKPPESAPQPPSRRGSTKTRANARPAMRRRKSAAHAIEATMNDEC